LQKHTFWRGAAASITEHTIPGRACDLSLAYQLIGYFPFEPNHEDKKVNSKCCEVCFSPIGKLRLARGSEVCPGFILLSREGNLRSDRRVSIEFDYYLLVLAPEKHDGGYICVIVSSSYCARTSWFVLK
jgi:hypothetical protein